MRHPNFRNILVIIVLVTVSLYSCKSKQEKELVNYWKLVDAKNSLRDSVRGSFANNITLMNASIDSIKEGKEREEFMADLNSKKKFLHMKDSIFSLQIAGSFLEIKDNGLYDCKLLDTKEAGTWKYDAKNWEFVTEPAGGSEGKLKVMKIGADSLIIGTDARNCLIFAASKKK